jgi:hypothetical protein
MSSLKLLNQDAEHAKRFVALAMNINAAKGLQEVLKTNLGPKVSVYAYGVRAFSCASGVSGRALGTRRCTCELMRIPGFCMHVPAKLCAVRVRGVHGNCRVIAPIRDVRRVRSRCWSEARATSS